MKKAREPDRHRAFASFGVGWRAGIGMVTGRQFGSLVGSAVGVIVGSRPTSDRRLKAPQPLRRHAAEHQASEGKGLHGADRAVGAGRHGLRAGGGIGRDADLAGTDHFGEQVGARIEVLHAYLVAFRAGVQRGGLAGDGQADGG